MTALPEAKLAREAEICYSILACSTDYDCWRESEVPVTVEMIVANLSRNAALSKAILSDVIPRVSEERSCACGSALENAIVTAREVIPSEARERLALLVDKYLQ
jgi:5'-methylthioadenosine phosphorylase